FLFDFQIADLKLQSPYDLRYTILIDPCDLLQDTLPLGIPPRLLSVKTTGGAWLDVFFSPNAVFDLAGVTPERDLADDLVRLLVGEPVQLPFAQVRHALHDEFPQFFHV